jgi:hypothetical protein
MSFGARNRILTAALLLPVILISLGFTGFALWRCQFDGVARTSCCCPADDSQAAAARGAEVSAASCCDVERYQAAPVPADLHRGPSMVALVVAVASSPVGVSPTPEPTTPEPRPACAADPPQGRDLLVRKQAFLI